MSTDARILIIAYTIQYEGNWNKIFERIQSRRNPSKKYVKLAESVKDSYITILDDNYPEALKQSVRPPFAYKFSGDVSKVHDKHILINSVARFKLAKHDTCVINSYGGGFCLTFSDTSTTFITKDYVTAIQISLGYCNKVVMDSGAGSMFVASIMTYYITQGYPVGCLPTIRTSKVNNLIKNGAYLYDGIEEEIDEWN